MSEKEQKYSRIKFDKFQNGMMINIRNLLFQVKRIRSDKQEIVLRLKDGNSLGLVDQNEMDMAKTASKGNKPASIRMYKTSLRSVKRIRRAFNKIKLPDIFQRKQILYKLNQPLLDIEGLCKDGIKNLKHRGDKDG